MSDSLRPHELQHTRPPCPSPAPGIYPNSCPLNWWCHLTISSSAIPFSCLQSFPTSGSFQMSQLFTSGGQNIGVSASTLVLPMNTQDWFPLGWTGWISLQPLKSLIQHHSSKASILLCLAFFKVQLSHLYITTGKTIARGTFVGTVMSLIFNMLSRFVKAFLPRSKCLLILWLQSPSSVICIICNQISSLIHVGRRLDSWLAGISWHFPKWPCYFPDCNRFNRFYLIWKISQS